MGNDFWVDMALSIVFSVLRQKLLLVKYEKAFRKLYNSIGMAYGWTSDNDTQTSLPGLVKP